ncbi:MAG: HNH endonuclease [Selenomonadaceae bacterium]|nr:HNH endonuclease [Selenomonadaceae bacterium]
MSDFLKDFLKKAEEIYKLMGINPDEKVNFSLKNDQDVSDEWIDPLIPGIEIYANDPRFKYTDEGLFYEGKRIILYIRDQVIYSSDWTGEFKYHLVWCTTLKTKHKQDSFGKYVVSSSTNGIFKVNHIENNKVVKSADEELHVCKHCLQKLNWKGYRNSSNKNYIYENFSLEEFFQVYGNDNIGQINVLPFDTDKTAPLNNYTDDWSEISAQQKRLKKYTCELCGKRFPNGKGLHVHHINTLKSDNRSSNFQVLCPDCHQKMHPDHKILDSNKND